MTIPKVLRKGRVTHLEKIVFKKAGIVVAVAAASLLAVSPLAFADDKGDGRHGDGDQVNYLDSGHDREQAGLINLGEVNALNDVKVCPGVTAAAGIGNLLGLLDVGDTDAEANSDDIECVNDDSATQVNVD
jgi:hypothetical protein